MVENKELEDIVLNKMDADVYAEGEVYSESGYSYAEVMKGLKEAYNLAIDRATESQNGRVGQVNMIMLDADKSEWMLRDYILKLKIE